jgi:hypothetical protein
MWPFGNNKVEAVNADIVSIINKIGHLKLELPATQRGWCSQLGLYVQMNDDMGHGKLEAGYKWKSFFLAERFDFLEDEWEVKKYVNGEWERLAIPSLRVTKWIAQMGGMPEELGRPFETLASHFRDSGDTNIVNEILNLRASTAS